MNKYGIENFTVETIGEFPTEELNEKEIYYIKKFNSKKPNGYNIVDGGVGVRGYKHDERSCKNMSKAQKLRWENMTKEEYEEECKKRSEWLTGKPKTEEHKKKLSELAKQRTGDKNPFYGRHHSEETKAILKERSTGRKSVRNIPIKCVDGDFTKEFNSYMDASLWLMDNGYTKSKNRTSVTSTIKESITGGNKRYGFYWFEL